MALSCGMKVHLSTQLCAHQQEAPIPFPAPPVQGVYLHLAKGRAGDLMCGSGLCVTSHKLLVATCQASVLCSNIGVDEREKRR